MGLYDYTLYNVFKRNARSDGNRLAFISGEEKVTYREVLEKVDRLAFGLSGIGLRKGDRIGVLAQNSLEYVYLYGAAAKLGAIMLPMNWRLSSQEVEYILSDGSPKVIFAGLEFHGMISPFISKSSFIEKCYNMGEACGDFLAFNDLMEKDGASAETNVSSDDPYTIIYTAAVHGKPRGAMLSHEGILNTNLQFMYRWHLTEKDSHILALPLYHNFGFVMTLTVMQARGLNIIIPRFDVDIVLKHIQENKVAILCEFPPMLSSLLNRAQEGHYDLSSLRIILGLEPPEIAKKAEEMTGATFWAGYAQTETTGFIALSPYFERLGSAGKPLFSVEVEIMDEWGRFVKTGGVGEIVIRGPMVFKGYWNLEKDNEYTFREGWHHTGDLGRFDEDGYLWYMGRKAEKELIKPGGENVYPTEVERVILEHPLVSEVSVIGVPDKQWGEAIKAICVLKEGKRLTENELIDFVASRIARYKKPKYITFVPNLPKMKDGFIDREKVKAIYGNI
jgi:long-chain acyl-CoA synthetase